MDAHFDPKGGKTTLSFSPKEADGLFVLMQLVIEEERRKGTWVPNFGDDFFRKLATTKEKFPVGFDFESFVFIS